MLALSKLGSAAQAAAFASRLLSSALKGLQANADGLQTRKSWVGAALTRGFSTGEQQADPLRAAAEQSAGAQQHAAEARQEARQRGDAEAAGGSDGGRPRTLRSQQWSSRGRGGAQQQAADSGDAPGAAEKGLWPAYIYNVSPRLLRRDVVAFFDGYNLQEDDVRPQFSWNSLDVERMWLAFGSREDRERAMSRHGAYLGTRRVLMRRANPHEFSQGVYNPLAMASRGRCVLVTNLRPNTPSEDVVRFFQGFDIHPKSVSFVRDGGEDNGRPSRHYQTQQQQRGPQRGQHKEQHNGEQQQQQGPQWAGSAAGLKGQQQARGDRAIVRFASVLEARRAMREKQGGFCGATQVRLRVLP